MNQIALGTGISPHLRGQCTQLERLLHVVVIVYDVVAESAGQCGPRCILAEVEAVHVDEGPARFSNHRGSSEADKPFEGGRERLTSGGLKLMMGAGEAKALNVRNVSTTGLN